MKSKLIALVLLITFSTSAYSQIENEIKTFVDSTEIIVNNGRKYLLEQTKQENLEKVREIYNYLNNATSEKPYAAFYYAEHLYINTILKDWNSLLRYASNYDSLKSETLPQNSAQIYSELFQSTQSNIEEYQEDIEFSKLTENEKVVIELLLQLTKIGSPDERYNALLKSYKSQKNNKYNSFVNHFLLGKTIKGSISYSFGSGMMFPTANLANEFNTTPLAEMSMDFNFGNIYTSLYFQGCGFAFQNEVNTRLNYDFITFQEGDRLTYFEGGLKAGYFIHRGDRFHFAPFAIISGATLESNIYEEEPSYDEFTVLNTFCYGAGVHTELKLKDIQATNYYGYEEKGYISLKLDCSYKQFAKFNLPQYKGALPTVSFAFVWGFGVF